MTMGSSMGQSFPSCRTLMLYRKVPGEVFASSHTNSCELDLEVVNCRLAISLFLKLMPSGANENPAGARSVQTMGTSRNLRVTFSVYGFAVMALAEHAVTTTVTRHWFFSKHLKVVP